MSRYISVDDMRGIFCQSKSLTQAWNGFDMAPTIDIVRCKECKHRPIKEDADGADHGFNLITPNESGRCPCLVDDGWYSWMPDDNFYCGYGERREP